MWLLGSYYKFLAGVQSCSNQQICQSANWLHIDMQLNQRSSELHENIDATIIYLS